MSIENEGGILGDPFERLPVDSDPSFGIEYRLEEYDSQETIESENLSIPNEQLRGMDEKKLAYYLGEKFDDFNVPALEDAKVNDIPYFGERMRNMPEEVQRESIERWYVKMGWPLRRSELVRDKKELNRRIEDLAGHLGLPVPHTKQEAMVVENIGENLGLRNDYGEWEDFWEVRSFVTNEQGTFAVCCKTYDEATTRLAPVDKLGEYQQVHSLLIDRKYNRLRNFAEEKGI